MSGKDTDIAREQAARVGDMLREVTDFLRSHMGTFEDPKGQALFETTGEVLLALTRAFVHYRERIEHAWR